MSNIIKFFAYGELMNEAHFREQGLDYKAKSSVTLSAWRIVFNKIPTDADAPPGLGLANIEPTPNNAGMMFGILYEMDETYLPRLDEIHQAPEEYQRKVVRFTQHDFNMTNGLVYVARQEKTKSGLKPSKAMLKTLKGAKQGLTMLYFSKLMITPTID